MKLDLYTWQARILPSIFFMLPFFVELNYFAVKIGFQITISTIVTNIFLLILLMLCAIWIRYFGRKKENKLFREWDGPPTTRYLRESNDEYNSEKRKEIKKQLKILFNQLSMPTANTEKSDSQKADKQYEAYIMNLRALTRDSKKFPLVQAENRSYGMLRNLLGIKLAACILNACLFIINILLCIFYNGLMPLYSCISLNVVIGIILLIWITIVTKSKVKDVANCYAERLLESVTLLMKY